MQVRWGRASAARYGERTPGESRFPPPGQELKEYEGQGQKERAVPHSAREASQSERVLRENSACPKLIHPTEDSALLAGQLRELPETAKLEWF